MFTRVETCFSNVEAFHSVHKEKHLNSASRERLVIDVVEGLLPKPAKGKCPTAVIVDRMPSS